MNEITVLLNPFRSMNEACIAIYIKSNYETEDCFWICKKYFSVEFFKFFSLKYTLVFQEFVIRYAFIDTYCLNNLAK